MSKVFERSLSYETVFDNYNLDLSPSVYGYEICQKNKPMIELDKPLYILHFVFGGKGYIFGDDDEMKEIGPSTCFICRPDSKMRYRQDPQDPWRYVWIEFGGISAKKICDSISFKDDVLKVGESELKRIKSIFRQMFDEDMKSSNPASEDLRISGLIFEILSVLSSKSSYSESSHEVSKKEFQIRQVIEYINSNYTRSDISIKSISEHFFFNPSYLSRTFKEFTNVSPSSYIIELRMKKAAELLRTGRYSISQIAYTLGFKNQFYFSREFTKFYQTAPSKYKKDSMAQ